MEKLRIIFMGTPEFAVPSLKKLCEVHEVVCVVTQPDRPKGRGQKLLPPPVKVFAEEKNIPILQPIKVKNPEVVAELKKFQADLIVVVAFGQILSQEILDLPKFGCINVHASLLPRYRGAAPIEWALINGEKITGVTTMQMNAGLDTGDMLLKSEVKIPDEMILPELQEKLMTTGAELLIKTLEKLQRGELQPIKQDDSLSNYAPMLKKETGSIDWNKSAREIHNLVRGLYGGAYAFMNGQKIKIWRTKIHNENSKTLPGKINFLDKKILIGTGQGSLEILEMQAPNGKKVDAEIICAGFKN
ncbi:MAG: methionyl-tRNA formyltransferase [Selenomonadaceae bacterium]|nr:methionyl-tRNA formyltransferase [Selenomonadaceae bacterium]